MQKRLACVGLKWFLKGCNGRYTVATAYIYTFYQCTLYNILYTLYIETVKKIMNKTLFDIKNLPCIARQKLSGVDIWKHATYTIL